MPKKNSGALTVQKKISLPGVHLMKAQHEKAVRHFLTNQRTDYNRVVKVHDCLLVLNNEITILLNEN